MGVVPFVTRFWHQIAVVLLSCVPIIESRYAIVLGKRFFSEIGTAELVVLTQFGAFVTALILLLLLRPIFRWMKQTRLLRKLAEKLEAHGQKKGDKLQKKMNNSASKAARVRAAVIGVFLFVAIPLPGTGVWTGALVATLLDIRFRYAFPAICLGSVCATMIMLLFSSFFFSGVAL